jgi:hypothetical protein
MTTQAKAVQTAHNSSQQELEELRAAALHLGVRKALSVVGSHYQVDFEAVSSGYVVPVGVEDEEAMNRADALAAPAADALAEDLMDFLFPDAPGADDPQA